MRNGTFTPEELAVARLLATPEGHVPLREFARVSGISYHTLHSFVHLGKLGATKEAGRVYLRLSQLKHFSAHTVRASAYVIHTVHALQKIGKTLDEVERALPWENRRTLVRIYNGETFSEESGT